MNSELQLQLQRCLDESAAGIGLFDPDEHLRYANPHFRSAYALGPDETPRWEDMMRRCHRERVGLLIDTPDIEAWLARVRRSHRQRPLRSFESDLVDGRWMRVTETLHADGWLLVLTTDVTTLKANESVLRQARDQAVRLSITDPLTGLHNRRHVFERLDGLFLDARELRYPLTLVVIDLDHFKQINDQHGHAAGDQVLTHFAQQLQHALRPQDLLGRIGGEEFLLVLPNTSPEGARQVLARLRSSLAASPAQAPPPGLRTNFSSGIAHMRPEDTIQTLWTRADRALYRAKNSGRGLDLDADVGSGFAV